MSGKSHLLVLRYRHFYTAKSKGNKKILTNINLLSILENVILAYLVSFKASIARKRMKLKLAFQWDVTFHPFCGVRSQIYNPTTEQNL